MKCTTAPSIEFGNKAEVAIAMAVTSEFPSPNHATGLHNLFANAQQQDLARATHIAQNMGAISTRFGLSYFQAAAFPTPGSRSQGRINTFVPAIMKGDDFDTFREATMLVALQDLPGVEAGDNRRTMQHTVKGARFIGAVLLNERLLDPSDNDVDSRFINRFYDAEDSFDVTAGQGAETLLQSVWAEYAYPLGDGTPDAVNGTPSTDASYVRYLGQNPVIVDLSKLARFD